MNKIAVLGLGLIGGSLGLALQQAGVAKHLSGYDSNQDTTHQAREIGAITEICDTAEKAVEEADMVILATPILAMRELLERIAPKLKGGALVTDTASTKVQILNWAKTLLPGHAIFVGGHPMAGRELSGIEAAEVGLFEGSTYCLIPLGEASSEGVEQLSEITMLLGAHPFVLGANRHDHLVAGISHLPFVLSSALVQCLSKNEDWKELTHLAAGGFRDMSRLAAGSPTMYRDICITNKEEILNWLDALALELNNIRSLITREDEVLEPYFEQAKQFRKTAFS
ncbi:MAG TPA: prephenate dehydrogenase/arogenate dehydrogenase family protein [Ktedonobacteraceae bacterium]|nr:prephenate dehydrogenase/arogenate dehydrogenase family protein [Ktedonobacteraceae bacterium]